MIFDPNWNPAHDLQAQDRSFRFGQKRHVIVFRLLAAGSLEELVYTRQVYKQQLSNIAVSGNMEKRYFEGVQVENHFPFFVFKDLTSIFVSFFQLEMITYSCCNFQDSKEFQGELFGICNLFRDLSDKLFTSEIIELHKKNGKEDDGTHSKQDLNVLGMNFVPEKEITTESFVGAESSKHKEEECKAVAPVLEDLGEFISYCFLVNENCSEGPLLIIGTNGKEKNGDYVVTPSEIPLQNKWSVNIILA